MRIPARSCRDVREAVPYTAHRPGLRVMARQCVLSAAALNLSLRASAHTGVAIRILLHLCYMFAGSDLLRAKPISLFVMPKRETAFDVKEKRALVGKGEPSGGRGLAACGRTIRGAPAVRSAAARPGPVRFLPARPLRLGSADARLLSHVILSIRVILSVSEESPGPKRPAPVPVSWRGSDADREAKRKQTISK